MQIEAVLEAEVVTLVSDAINLDITQIAARKDNKLHSTRVSEYYK